VEFNCWAQHIGDTKAGTLIGIDNFGNKFFENQEEELPLRTRWVDYKQYEWDP
jgi:NADH:ubiquinone oxidoreductase subunit